MRRKHLEAQVADLEARMEALETARPTVELLQWDRVPVLSEPLNVQEMLRAVSAEYAHGWCGDEDWRAGYI